MGSHSDDNIRGRVRAQTSHTHRGSIRKLCLGIYAEHWGNYWQIHYVRTVEDIDSCDDAVPLHVRPNHQHVVFYVFDQHFDAATTQTPS